MAAIHRLINVFLRRAWTGQFTRRPCSHLDMINDVQPASEVPAMRRPRRQLASPANVFDLRERRVL